MKKILLLSFLYITTLASCVIATDSGTESSINVAISDEKVKNGFLEITLPDERPKNMAIQTPNGEWYVLQEEAESIEIMPQNIFNTIKVLTLDVKNVMGYVWRNGVKSKEHVFKDKGTYVAYFADNLETEPENTFSIRKTIVYQ